MFKFNNFRRAFGNSKYGKLALVAVCASLVVAAVVVSGGLQSASATNPCAAIQPGTITVNGSGTSAQVTVTNPNTSSNCSYNIGLASYKAFVAWNGNNSQEYIDGQTLFDSRLVTVPAGTSQTITVSLPSCNYQIDFFQGNRVPSPPDFGAASNNDLHLFSWKQSFSLGYCSVPVPTQLTCSANASSAPIGSTVSFNANGGNGTYNWNSAGGSPASAAGIGASFSASYFSSGFKNVSVSSDGQTAFCPVTISQPNIPPPPPAAPFCSPSTQTVNENQGATLSATGGDNFNFSWSVTGGGDPSTGTGQSFNPSFSTPGTKTVTVTSNGLSDQCTIVVRQPQVDRPPPTCSPSDQSANVGDDVSFTADGGNGTFTWTTPFGTPANSTGSTFDTVFNTAGTKTVTVHSNGRSAICTVEVNQIQQTPLTCSPSSQNSQLGQSVSFVANGGSGNYTWTTPFGNPANSTGSNFNTVFNSAGNQTVTVRSSDGQSAQCFVNVQQQINQNLSCTANTSSASAGTFVTFNAIGGNGNYSWNTGSGNPTFGNGQSFSSQFFNQGFQTVTVTSNGQVAQCGVTIQQQFFPQVPTCSVSNQNPSVNQQVTFFGSGGTGNFSWTAQTGQPTFGYGTSFNTSFSNPGTQVVTLNSNGQTSQCTVNVEQNFINNAPVCTPSTQNANVNDFVTFSVSGGNGNYIWNTSGDASPSSQSGNSFGTRFSTAGTKIVTVNSNGQTSQCVVQIGQVLGASTVDTGSDDGGMLAAGLGFIGALGTYGAVFRKNSKKFLLRLVGRAASK